MKQFICMLLCLCSLGVLSACTTANAPAPTASPQSDTFQWHYDDTIIYPSVGYSIFGGDETYLFHKAYNDKEEQYALFQYDNKTGTTEPVAPGCNGGIFVTKQYVYYIATDGAMHCYDRETKEIIPTTNMENVGYLVSPNGIYFMVNKENIGGMLLYRTNLLGQNKTQMGNDDDVQLLYYANGYVHAAIYNIETATSTVLAIQDSTGEATERETVAGWVLSASDAYLIVYSDTEGLHVYDRSANQTQQIEKADGYPGGVLNGNMFIYVINIGSGNSILFAYDIQKGKGYELLNVAYPGPVVIDGKIYIAEGLNSLEIQKVEFDENNQPKKSWVIQ